MRSSPPAGFGRLAGCQYPCVVVEEGQRWPGRVFAWEQSNDGWRALVRFTRTDDVGGRRTSEQWLDLSSIAPAVA